MYEVMDSDSPHLSGAQPTWRQLEFVAEMTNFVWERPTASWEDLQAKLRGKVGKSKIGSTASLMRKLDILTENNNLTFRGVWLATEFDPAPSTRGKKAVTIGVKKNLSDVEAFAFRQILFQYDWTPMVATINQLGTERVPDQETLERAVNFVDRIDHLSGYDASWSDGTKKKKAQVHFEWAKRLRLAYRTNNDDIALSPLGKVTHEYLADWYPESWAGKPESD